MHHLVDFDISYKFELIVAKHTFEVVLKSVEFLAKLTYDLQWVNPFDDDELYIKYSVFSNLVVCLYLDIFFFSLSFLRIVMWWLYCVHLVDCSVFLSMKKKKICFDLDSRSTMANMSIVVWIIWLSNEQQIINWINQWWTSGRDLDNRFKLKCKGKKESLVRCRFHLNWIVLGKIEEGRDVEDLIQSVVVVCVFAIGLSHRRLPERKEILFVGEMIILLKRIEPRKNRTINDIKTTEELRPFLPLRLLLLFFVILIIRDYHRREREG